jgi:glycosyltransferase involved in cell wall biosynthesis
VAKILILIGGHLCNAPRPQKEAETLAVAGHNVTVRGFWFDPEMIERDRLLMVNKKWRFEPIIDFQPKHRLKNLGIRLQNRIAKELFQRFGIFSPNLLSYGTTAMLKAARQEAADLTIVHSEPGLWVGSQLLDQGFCIGVDFEDWFSEDLPLKEHINRPIAHLKALESRLMRECTYCLTTSHSLAGALNKAYQASTPTVIYNTFPIHERGQIDFKKRDRQNLNLPSLHWFSQTIGPGRGLDTLLLALPYLKIPVEIHLRGNYPDSYRQWLEPLIPPEWRDFIFIHPTVPNQELISRIAEHDIGLALETPYCSNRQLTITNKFFQYLQAGLAVIATDTAGQTEILSQRPNIGRLIPSNNPLQLAQAIEDLLQTPNKLISAKKAALEAAQEQFCWEKEAQKLIDIADTALRQHS